MQSCGGLETARGGQQAALARAPAVGPCRRRPSTASPALAHHPPQAEYSRLVYECVAQDCSGSWDIWMEQPAVLKPQKLWTGKQVRRRRRGRRPPACSRPRHPRPPASLHARSTTAASPPPTTSPAPPRPQVFTAVLMHYTRDQLPLTLFADSKVPADIWGRGNGAPPPPPRPCAADPPGPLHLACGSAGAARRRMHEAGRVDGARKPRPDASRRRRPPLLPRAGEGHMHIWRNHLVAGCVDKNSFGKHGLLHAIYVSEGAGWGCGLGWSVLRALPRRS